MFEIDKKEGPESLVRRHYERWPYPHIPLFAQVWGDQLWQLNTNWLKARSGQTPVNDASRIWIAGCGTFQPYLVAQANPGSSILATDWSQSSLDRAKTRGRLHRLKGIEYRRLDLNEPETFPPGPFDFIESYGVLMILKDPVKTLRAFAERLAPGGVVRVMIYPHYGRQRVFQIQRLAKLLGLNSGEKSHPKILKRFMQSLPDSHPLKFAFFTYPDSTNWVGIADGFLHAGDRGFSGIDIAKIIDEAGFDLGYPLHRPWGQPKEMEAALGIRNQDPAFWLHYLDLWQSLKGNFILTLTKKSDLPTKVEKFQHPIFNWQTKGMSLRQRARLIRMSLTGGKLQSRTHPTSLKVSARVVRQLMKGEKTDETAPFFPDARPLGAAFQGSREHFEPHHSWTLGAQELSPNPLYSHLFDAYLWDADGKLPSLKEQIDKWKSCARPLEDELHPFGLTPFGTYQFDPEHVGQAVEVYRREKRSLFSQSHLENEEAKFVEIKNYLQKFPFPVIEWNETQLRELWVLVFSYSQLFLKTKPI